MLPCCCPAALLLLLLLLLLPTTIHSEYLLSSVLYSATPPLLHSSTPLHPATLDTGPGELSTHPDRHIAAVILSQSLNSPSTVPRCLPVMSLSSSYAIYLHNLFHPATFFVLFTFLLLASVAFLELLLFALLAAGLTFVFHRLTPLHSLPPTYAVLLTGSSSGIGEEVALRLASLGMKVFAGVRKEADGYRLQVKARQVEGNIRPLLLDVTSQSDIAAAYSHIRATCAQKGWRLYAIILNAGMGEYGPVELISAARMRRQYEVNVVAPHVLTQTFLPLLRLSASPPPSLFLSSMLPFKSSTPLQPRVLFMSSVASRVTVPGRGVYCSSKHALESLAAAYRVELHAFGVRVVSICPGELYSSFHNNSKKLYAEVVRECTDRAVQAPSSSVPSASHTATSSSSLSSPASSVPLPLPLSFVRHYDRVYDLCRQRWRVVGSPDIAADAVEVALRTRWPLPRYDCGDDAAALPILQLLPSKWIDFGLGLPFYTTAAPLDSSQQRTDQTGDVEAEAEEDHTAESSEAADSRRTEAVRRVSGRLERAMEKERREAADEEKQTFIDATEADLEEGGAVFTVEEVTPDEPPQQPRATHDKTHNTVE